MQQARKLHCTEVGPFRGEFTYMRPSTSDPDWTKVLLMDLESELSERQRTSLEKKFGRIGSELVIKRVPKGGLKRRSFMVYLWIPIKYDVYSLPIKRLDKKVSKPSYLLLSLRGENLYVFIEKDGVRSRLITRKDPDYKRMQAVIYAI